MSNYSKSTNFATKDSLASGNPLKVIKGTEIDDEFEAIETAIATKPDSSDVDAAIAAAKAAMYPVGSVYINATNSTNPATLLGFGTWTAFGAGRVPVGIDSSNTLFDTAEETGGSADAIVVSHTHTGTTDADGAHSHEINNAKMGSGATAINHLTIHDFAGGTTITTDTEEAHTHSFTTGSTGSSGTNANYQPYITVYMWKRTA